MPIHCSSPDWTIVRFASRKLTLKRAEPVAGRWYVIRLTTEPLLAVAADSVTLRRNLHGQPSPLLPGRKSGECELVFRHATALHTLQLELPPALAHADLPIRLEITETSTPQAITRMLAAVYRRDRSDRADAMRIFRKSAKRLVLHGRERFVGKLIRDYHPQEAIHYQVGDAYAAWIAAVETPALLDPSDRARDLETPRTRPLFSVLLRTREGEPQFIEQTIASLLRQRYPHWELCIGDVTADSALHPSLEQHAARDDRIRLAPPATPGMQLAADNIALDLARGDYIVVLEAGDTLADHALHRVARTLDARPEAAFLYSDEDCIDEAGRRYDPDFKCDWNPDLFFSRNYVGHGVWLRRDLLRSVGGFRAEAEPCPDYDLLLRCLLVAKTADIVHLPDVLYHRRAVDSDTRHDGDDDAVATAERDALRRHFAAVGRSNIAVEPGLAARTHRIRYPVPDPAPLVSLLVPTRDRLELLEPCVRSILDKTSYTNFEILILDNQSVEPATHAFFERIRSGSPRIRVLSYPHPFNYSAINNHGVRHARGTLIGLINNDIEVIGPDWLTEMVSHVCRPEIGCVGAKLYYANDTIQHAGIVLGLWGVAGHAHKRFPRHAEGYRQRVMCVQNFSAVTAACLVVRKDVYLQVGGLDEAHLAVSFNDVDFCLKVRGAGYRNLWTPYAELYHLESISRGTDDTPEKKSRERREIDYMRATWAAALDADPCYSPNLTHRREDFSINTDFIKT